MTMASKDRGLEGLWFLSFIPGKDGKVLHPRKPNWQGVVTRDLGNGYCTVQLHDWLAGMPSTIKLVRLDDMRDWDFFMDDEDLRHAAKGYAARA